MRQVSETKKRVEIPHRKRPTAGQHYRVNAQVKTELQMVKKLCIVNKIGRGERSPKSTSNKR